MKVDITSMFFNSTIEGGTATAAWGTSIGQSNSRNCRIDTDKVGVTDFIVGLTYKSKTDREHLDMSHGRSQNKEILSFSVFEKIYINGTKLDNSQYTIVLIRELSNSHFGRLLVSYAPYIKYNAVANSEAIDQMRDALRCTSNGCWFVYDISILNQDELHFNAVVVDKDNPVNYQTTSQERSRIWKELAFDAERKAKPQFSFTPVQKIFFGTPGSGKSHKINEETKDGKVFRTTFHPDYDFSTFVGCYKPVKEDGEITYSFVPQCFTNAYIYAWKNPDKKVFLIIEEINRGNCAQIFGDVFQLLDRNEKGFSDYPIQPNKDLGNYLAEELHGIFDGELVLPPNFNILASMNTSDQSLFPMDSAFKRRWDWEYVPIDYQNVTSKAFAINLSDTKYSWTEFLQSVNAKIFAATDSEDKQMGNFFIKKDVDTKEFISKVMFYLWAEICKDEYGTDSKRNFFRDADNDDKEFSFNELSGNNEKLLKGFFKYIEKESKRD